jgi:hypothetical protein
MEDRAMISDAAHGRGHGPRKVTLAIALFAILALLTTGAVLVRHGLHGHQPSAAPLPSAAFSFADSAAATVDLQAAVPAAATVPNRIYIPSLGVDAALVSTGIANNSLVIPHDVHQVGLWSGGGQLDGTQGTVLVAGHVNDVSQGKGALWTLASIAPLTDIWTTDAAGVAMHWRTVRLSTVLKAALPSDLFAANGARRLVVVTCGGAVHDGAYDRNVVAEAVPAPIVPTR